MALTCRVEEPSTASIGDIRTAENAIYSITSSARPSNDSVTSCDPATLFGLIEEPLNSLDLGICA